MVISISKLLVRFSKSTLVMLLVGCWLLAAGSAFAQQADAQEKDAKAEITPVPVESGIANIGPENTRIAFIGLHTGDDPRPRLGGFKEFDGQLLLEGSQLAEISVEIQIESIWTEFDKLTQHLQAADFLNAKEYPTAKFHSTAIGPGEAGALKVTGTLALHGTESEITFPAKVHVTDRGLVLKSEFKIDRTLFGMTEHLDGVEKLVSVSVVVGQPTERADDERATE